MKPSIIRGFQSTIQRYSNRIVRSSSSSSSSLVSTKNHNSTTTTTTAIIDTIRNNNTTSVPSPSPTTSTFHRFHPHCHTPNNTVRVLLASTFLFVTGRLGSIIQLLPPPLVRAFPYSSGTTGDCPTRRLFHHHHHHPSSSNKTPNHNPHNHNHGMTMDGGDGDGNDDDPCISSKATTTEEVSIHSTKPTTTTTTTTTADNNNKSTQDLQKQWAGGRDIWRSVPLLKQDDGTTTTTVSIQNRVRQTYETDEDDGTTDRQRQRQQPWPEVVRNSVLYGFGAYNPRGRTLPHDVNIRAHTSLQNDIQNGLDQWNNPPPDGRRSGDDEEEETKRVVWWWEGASVWDDGSSERGFVIACRCKEENEDDDETDDTVCTQVQEWVVGLATRYDQGAIYRYKYQPNDTLVDDGEKDTTTGGGGGRLMRETIAVLDPGTDAIVEVVRDDDGDGIDFTPFGE